MVSPAWKSPKLWNVVSCSVLGLWLSGLLALLLAPAASLGKNFRTSQCKAELKFIKRDVQKGGCTQEHVRVYVFKCVCVFLRENYNLSIFAVDIDAIWISLW